MACRTAMRKVGKPMRLPNWPISVSGVSPGRITRADKPSAQAEAVTIKVSEWIS